MRRIFLILLGVVASTAIHASEVTFGFKNPAFSGQGYSNHVLAIDQLQQQRKKEREDEEKALARELERDAENTTLAKFLKNVESRIYANISKSLVDGMFEDDGATSGTAEIEGATITWNKDVTSDTITVIIIEEDGTTTELTVPMSGFGF
jgi:Na+-transporting NADH:ubiquinone oxidoreductase subunit NqrC